VAKWLERSSLVLKVPGTRLSSELGKVRKRSGAHLSYTAVQVDSLTALMATGQPLPLPYALKLLTQYGYSGFLAC